MPRDALIAIGGGLMSAVAFAAISGGTFSALLLVYFAPFPLLMVGLGLGPRAATVAVAIGFFATGLLGNAYVAGVYGVVIALPPWVLVVLLMRRLAPPDGSSGVGEWPSPGSALSALALLAGVTLVLASASVSDGNLAEQVAASVREATDGMVSVWGDVRREMVVATVAPIVPGGVAAFWVVIGVVNAIIAQGILVRMGRNLRSSPPYADLELPQWASWPLLAAAAVALMGTTLGSGDLAYIGRNAAMVFAAPYFFLGLAVVHTLARRVAFTGPVLVALYMVILVSGWAAVVVAGIGIAEQWVGLRHRAPNGNGDAGPENEA